MNHLRSIIAALLLVALPSMAHAQCRSFAKNKCMPAMAPYKFNETFNAAQLAPGEEAQVDLTFYSGQEYRLLVCSHPILGTINWQLLDANGKPLFESTPETPSDHFDFKVATTQKLTVHIDVPKAQQGGNNMLTVGCIGILVGHKE
ncbi:MAG: hypothetical protein JST38_05500 [Bacteroidetes bacterium]|nr:hypothetical protein [Bacteroidota bacterium]MBS1940314.1 hypothetical protein [Bacteroidota bacterium]